MYNQEYLNQISKKLDALNKANGVNQETRKQHLGGDFDIFSDLGNSALKYLDNKKNQDPIAPDPLFKDHN